MSLAQLGASFAALDLTLSVEKRQMLVETSAPTLEYPGGMIANGSTVRQRLLDTGVDQQI
jgi:hypothetical protein